MKINTSRIHSLSNWAKGSFKRKAISAHNMGILAVSLHKSRLVATASADKTAKLFDLHAGICVRTFVGHELSVGCVQMDSSKVNFNDSGRDDIKAILN